MSGKEQGVSWFVSNGDILGITFAVPTWHRLLRTRLSNCSGWRTVLCVKFDWLLRGLGCPRPAKAGYIEYQAAWRVQTGLYKQPVAPNASPYPQPGDAPDSGGQTAVVASYYLLGRCVPTAS